MNSNNFDSAKPNPNIVLFGSEGMLGSMVSYYLSQKRMAHDAFSRKEFDAEKVDAHDFLQARCYKPGTYVLNCIGMVNRRVDKDSLASLIRVNSLFPHALAEACEARGLQLIHVSTDCVFSGTEGGSTESSPSSATDLYGMSTALGEPADHAMVIRTSLIGPEVKNFYLLMSWVMAHQGRKLFGYRNHFWNGVTSLQFAKIIEKIMGNASFEKGIFHFFSPGNVTKDELLRMIAKSFDVQVQIECLDAARRVDRRLKTVKSLCLHLQIPSLEDQLKEMAEIWRTGFSEIALEKRSPVAL